MRISVPAAIYPRVAKKLGLKRTLQAGLVLTVPVFLLVSTLTLVKQHGASNAAFWVCLITLYSLRQLCGQITFSPVLQMVNNRFVAHLDEAS